MKKEVIYFTRKWLLPIVNSKNSILEGISGRLRCGQRQSECWWTSRWGRFQTWHKRRGWFYSFVRCFKNMSKEKTILVNLNSTSLPQLSFWIYHVIPSLLELCSMDSLWRLFVIFWTSGRHRNCCFESWYIVPNTSLYHLIYNIIREKFISIFLKYFSVLDLFEVMQHCF